MQLDNQTLESILRNGLNDTDVQVKNTSAEWVGKLRFTSLGTEVRALFNTTNNPYEKADYCKTLKALELPCE